MAWSLTIKFPRQHWCSAVVRTVCEPCLSRILTHTYLHSVESSSAVGKSQAAPLSNCPPQLSPNYCRSSGEGERLFGFEIKF
jgi:hypothetical protein